MTYKIKPHTKILANNDEIGQSTRQSIDCGHCGDASPPFSVQPLPAARAEGKFFIPSALGLPITSILNASSSLRWRWGRNIGRWDLTRDLNTFWETLPLSLFSANDIPSIVCSGMALYRFFYQLIAAGDMNHIHSHIKHCSLEGQLMKRRME